MEEKYEDGTTHEELGKLDTCTSSILHHFFTGPPTQKVTFLKDYLVPYAVSAILLYGIPLLIAVVVIPDNIIHDPPSGLKVGFLDDWALLIMNLITIPLLLVFILTERNMIPESIRHIIEAGVISVDETGNGFAKLWKSNYRKINVIGQLVGVAMAIIGFYLNYKAESSPDYSGWQLTGGNLNVAGWVFLCWQVPLLYWITTVYIIRGIATIFFLRDLSQKFTIEVSPFHQDNCCGLKPIGHIGLRNQYILAVAGINVIALWLVFLRRGEAGPAFLFFAAVSTYVIFGPLVFIGPLLPFRKSMLSAKNIEQGKVATALERAYRGIIEKLKQRPMEKEDEELIERLQKLKAIVNRIPVWPFDTSTLRRFFAAYLTPFLTAFISLLIYYLSTKSS